MYEICLSLLLHLFVSDDVDIYCSEQEQSVSDVHGYDLITEKQIDGTLTLPKYGVAILA